ncbi:MAG: energy transducer TonB, partial [Pacificimonas sp.]
LGPGTGDSGFGRGGGGVTRAEKIAGTITDDDYPRAARQRRSEGEVTVNYDITTGGRVVNCRVVGPSGDVDLDATTCRLIRERFRYRPATRAGQPVADVAGWRQSWWLEGRR